MNTVLLRICLAALLLLASPASLPAAETPVAVVSSVVKIYTLFNRPNYHEPWQRWGQKPFHGSGAIISGQRILTNAHVVSDQVFVQVRRAGDATRYTAEVVAVGHECDLAILTVRDPAFFEGSAPLEIGPLADIRDRVAVFGFPEGGDKLSITEGVVSRVEHTNYAHSGAYLLACQMDAAINSGSSGGPVIRDERIVGVAFQGMNHQDYQNIGYMVPAPVITHFLEDIADGSYDGTPDLGLSMQKLENPALRRRFGLAPGQTGVLINRLYPDSPAAGRMQEADVITAIEGVPVANDGTISFRPEQRTFFGYLMQQKHIGDRLRIDTLRQGLSRPVTLSLTQPMDYERLVPHERFDTTPTYMIAGGLVFVPLTLNYLKEYGDNTNWFVHAPKELLHYYLHGEPSDDRRQLIVLIKVLADEVNVGYHETTDTIIRRINGRSVPTMAHLAEAFDTHRGEYHEIQDIHGFKLVIDRQAAADRLGAILEKYAIPSDRSPDLKPEVD